MSPQDAPIYFAMSFYIAQMNVPKLTLIATPEAVQSKGTLPLIRPSGKLSSIRLEKLTGTFINNTQRFHDALR